MDSRPPIVVEGILRGNDSVLYAVLFKNGYKRFKTMKDDSIYNPADSKKFRASLNRMPGVFELSSQYN